MLSLKTAGWFEFSAACLSDMDFFLHLVAMRENAKRSGQ